GLRLFGRGSVHELHELHEVAVDGDLAFAVGIPEADVRIPGEAQERGAIGDAHDRRRCGVRRDALARPQYELDGGMANDAEQAAEHLALERAAGRSRGCRLRGLPAAGRVGRARDLFLQSAHREIPWTYGSILVSIYAGCYRGPAPSHNSHGRAG